METKCLTSRFFCSKAFRASPSMNHFEVVDEVIPEAQEMQETQITPNQQRTASFNLNIIVFEFDFVTKENFVFLLMGEPVGCWPFISSRKHANTIEHVPNGSPRQPAVDVIVHLFPWLLQNRDCE